MSNIKDAKSKSTPITLCDGVERELRFTLNALAELEERYGTVEDAFKALNAARKHYKEQLSTITENYTAQLKELKEAFAEAKELVEKNLGLVPSRTEGVRDGRWGVLDYGDVIVHIFNDETRLFYHLENLWGDESNIVRYE